jgi:urease accessory protein
MLHHASIHCQCGHWPRHEAAGALTLDFESRHRRRILLRTDQGEEVLLDLPRAVAMADGDGLRLEDGRWLEVRAAAESVVEIRHPAPAQLVRLAWHLGNRHLPTEIGTGVLCIRPDPVIEVMLVGLGAVLVGAQRPFQPEGGAHRRADSHESPRHHEH